MRIDELKNTIKIKWNDFYIYEDCRCYSDVVDFDITPEDFLIFAKQDYKLLDKKGFIGSLSNSKRAIDCQIDWIISYLGFDYLNFNEKRYPEIKLIIEEFENELKHHKDLTMKLRFIQALEIAPTFLISKIRKIRNELEHEYVLPKKEDVRDAIEIAELFINATQNIIFKKFCTDYFIKNENSEHIKEPCIKVSFETIEKPHIDIYYWGNEEGKITLYPEDKKYINFLKIAVTNEFLYLVDVFGYKIDKKHINYTIL